MKTSYNYKLLIESYSDIIKETVQNSTVTIIKGPTGCGKSTYVPLILNDNKKKIAIIEPRRIAVTSLYKTLSSVISNVGYKMRFSKKVDKSTNIIIYTDGAFLNDIRFDMFDYIIVDEVHERSIRIDLILSLIKNNNCKAILMSATVDLTKIQKYFNASIIEVKGKSYPVDIIYSVSPVSDYIIESYCTIKNIIYEEIENKKKKHSSEDRNIMTVEDFLGDSVSSCNKDILVFLTGEDDINEMSALLKKILDIKVYKIYSNMDDHEQSKIYEICPLRKVILSTNICETSLTIPGIKYVVDCGLAKTKIYDGINYLGIMPISKESADQRLGRCNRTGPGVCYRLYTKETYESLDNLTPEITKCDLAKPILQIVKYNLNIFSFNLLDYPSQKNLERALEILLSFHLIKLQIKYKKLTYEIENKDGCELIFIRKDKNKYIEVDKNQDIFKQLKLFDIYDVQMCIKISNYGNIINNHPFDVNLSCFYQECIKNKVSYYGSILMSLISIENYNFIRKSEYLDIEYLIKLFEGYLEVKNKVLYCKQKEISHKSIDRAHNIFKTLEKKKGGDVSIVEKIFSNVFKYNLSVKEKDGSYKHIKSNTKVYVHPTSNFFKRNEKFIVFVDIICTTKEYIRIAGKFFK